MASVAVPCSTNFCFQKWKRMTRTTFSFNITGPLAIQTTWQSKFAHRLQKPNNQPILWISKSKILAGILKMQWLEMWPEKLIPWSILKTLIIKIFKKHLISVFILYSVSVNCVTFLLVVYLQTLIAFGYIQCLTSFLRLC